MKICQSCYSIHDGKKWFTDEQQWHELSEKHVASILCEACRRMRNRVVHGIVYLRGNVIRDRREEIIRMIRREEEIKSSRNHLSRILRINTQEDDQMTITTINQWLAIHIGKQFKKAFKGRMEIERDASGRRGRGTKGREEVVVRWWQEPTR